ncbi:MAG: trehalose-phosphatase, partial [Pyrobaculum sp.]
PDQDLLNLLERLAALSTVAVVSGRTREFLDAWLGKLPICLVAEHGAYVKEGGEWRQLFPFDTSWKTAVRKIMEEFIDATPGSYIEEKESSIAWHYRNVDPQIGETAASRLVEALSGVLTGTTASVVKGRKVVEVRPAGVNKGAAARYLIEKLGPDFVLAAGDDATDEDMYKAVGHDAVTIRVGRGDTAARHYVPSYKKLRELLARLVETSVRREAF